VPGTTFFAPLSAAENAHSKPVIVSKLQVSGMAGFLQCGTGEINFGTRLILLKTNRPEKFDFLSIPNIWSSSLAFGYVLENIAFLLCFITFYAFFVKKTGLWVGI